MLNGSQIDENISAQSLASLCRALKSAFTTSSWSRGASSMRLSQRHRWSHWHKVKVLHFANNLEKKSQWTQVEWLACRWQELFFLQYLSAIIYKKSVIWIYCMEIENIFNKGGGSSLRGCATKEVKVNFLPSPMTWIWSPQPCWYMHLYAYTLTHAKEISK